MGATSDLLPRGAITNLLTMDERVEWIAEVEKDKPMFGTHRYQLIQVRRGQMLCDFVKDMGPSFLYANAPPMQQAWLGGQYSVGEAMEIADRMREHKPPEEREPTDLVDGYLRQQDEKRALRAHRSVSGPLVRIERR